MSVIKTILANLASTIGTLVLLSAMAYSVYTLGQIKHSLDINNSLTIMEIQQLQEISKMRSI